MAIKTKKSSLPQTLPTRNDGWGFFGTYRSNTGADEKTTADAFAQAQRAIMAVLTVSAEDARDLLDARDGRHLADAVAGKAWVYHAVYETVMAWSTSYRYAIKAIRREREEG